MICLGTYTVAAAVLTAVTGMATPEEIQTYISLNGDPWDNNEQIDFEEPMGSYGIEYNFHKNFKLFAEHISSPMQCNDHPGINHAGIKFVAPTGDLNVYSGISVNNPHIDSNDRFDGPLVSLGVEWGKTIKLFAEHLTSVQNISEGRTAFGFKVFFK